MVEPGRWRWTVLDPYGNPVRCAEGIWQHVLNRRQRMAGHEMAVQATVRRPDAIYLDPRGTRFTYNPDAWVVIHVAADLTNGAYAGNLINVCDPLGATRGQSTHRLRHHRLSLPAGVRSARIA